MTKITKYESRTTSLCMAHTAASIAREVENGWQFVGMREHQTERAGSWLEGYFIRPVTGK
jgi:hypothetical protein